MALLLNENLHDLPAEMGVISAMMYGNDAIAKAIDMLRADMFYKKLHTDMFNTMVKMYEHDISVDPITLIEQMKREKIINGSDEAYIMDVYDVVVSDANIRHHAGIVKEKYRLRELVKLSAETERLTLQCESSQCVIDTIEQRITAIDNDTDSKGLIHVSEYVTPVMKEISDSMTSRKVKGLLTGFDGVDRIMGGLLPGNLIIMAGRPSMGKTSAALQMAINVARQGKSVAIFSLEMSTHELIYRGCSLISGIRLEDIIAGRNLTHGHVSRISEAMEEMKQLPIFIDDSSGITPLYVKSKIRRIMFNGNNRLDFVLVDHLGLMGSHSAKGKQNRHLEIGEMTKYFKGFAKEAQIPVCLLNQLNRNLEHREDKKPRLSDLRESGNIEEDADKVIMLYRDDYYTKEESLKPNVAEFIICKNRNGGIGTHEMFFDKMCTRFMALGEGVKHGIH